MTTAADPMTTGNGATAPNLPSPGPRAPARWWAWAAVLGLIVLGLAARDGVWRAASTIRFARDLDNAYQWGLRVNSDGRVASGPTTWPEWFDGYRRIYDRELASPNPAVFPLDYAPGRLMVMSLWARGVAGRDAARIGAKAWSWDDVRPLLWLNTACALASAVGAGALVRHWSGRHRADRGGGWSRALVAAALLWLNPALLADGHVWPQWDVWCLPFFLWAAYAASVGGWVWAGALLALGAMFKGQLLLVTPAVAAWAWSSEGLEAGFDWVVGFLAATGLAACAWLVPDAAAWAWAGCALAAAVAAWCVRGRQVRAWIAVPVVATGLAWPAALTFGPDARWLAIAAMCGIACAPVLPLWRRLSRVSPGTYFAAAVAVAIWGACWLFGGSLAWARVGFLAPINARLQMSMGASNLPNLLAVRWFWMSGDPVWRAVTIRTTLQVVYGVLAMACGLVAAVHARRGSARVLLAMTAPWLLMYALLPQMLGRYLVWGAAVSAVGVVVGRGVRFALLHLVVTAVATGDILRWLLARDDSSMPGVREWLDWMDPAAGWLVLGVAAVYLWQAVGWPGEWRRRAARRTGDARAGPAATVEGRRGFSLVELLVVLGIIGLLIGLLLPVVSKARGQAKQVQCASQMRQVGAALLMYANNNRGWIVPVGEWDGTQFESLGTNVEPFLRWPTVVFDLGPLPTFPVDDPAVYRPATMVCPVEEEPREAHSYILNKHLARGPTEVKKYGSRIGRGKGPSDVALLGEKFPDVRDYYMEKEPGMTTEFSNVVDEYKHGISAGANYLFLDLHVGRQTAARVPGSADPWDVPRDGPGG